MVSLVCSVENTPPREKELIRVAEVCVFGVTANGLIPQGEKYWPNRVAENNNGTSSMPAFFMALYLTRIKKFTLAFTGRVCVDVLADRDKSKSTLL